MHSLRNLKENMYISYFGLGVWMPLYISKINMLSRPICLGRYAVIGCKLKQNANEGCNSCASLAGLILSFIACFTCDRSLIRETAFLAAETGADGG